MELAIEGFSPDIEASHSTVSFGAKEVGTWDDFENEKDVRKKTSKSCILELPLENDCALTFNLETAICNHGMFMMPPNHWNPSTKTLKRPLRLTDSTLSVTVSISHPYKHNSILIELHDVDHLSSIDVETILAQVARMLRISVKDERDVQTFQNVHPKAKERGFGRLFHSPSLFEDAVKSILLCHCTWARSLKMSEYLCKLQLKLSNGILEEEIRNMNMDSWKGLKKRRRGGSKKNKCVQELDQYMSNVSSTGDEKSLGNFPTPKELASLNEEILRTHCNLGLRAVHILKFARDVESGKLNLKEFEDVCDSASFEKLYGRLKKVNGFGPFASANVMMCIGYYEKVPQDTETIRHLSQIHGIKNCNRKTITSSIKRIYGNYAPFQCLAYWLELLEYYEKKFGRLSELPVSSYGDVTGSIN